MGSVASFFNSLALATFLTALGYIADHYGPVKGLLAAEIVMALMLSLFWRVHHGKKANSLEQGARA